MKMKANYNNFPYLWSVLVGTNNTTIGLDDQPASKSDSASVAKVLMLEQMYPNQIDETIKDSTPYVTYSEDFEVCESLFDEQPSLESHSPCSKHRATGILSDEMIQQTNMSIDSFRDFEEQNKNTLLLMRGTLDSIQNESEVQEGRNYDYDQAEPFEIAAGNTLADSSDQEKPEIEGIKIKDTYTPEEVIEENHLADQEEKSINNSPSNVNSAKLLSPKDNNIKTATQPQQKKKPFLKKGTRKEPSSIHRFEVAKRVTSVGKADSKNHLEHLEKMQRDQIEQLEKRIERRERSKVDRNKNNVNDDTQNCCGINKQINSNKGNENIADESDVDSTSDDSSYASSSSSSSSQSCQVDLCTAPKGQKFQRSKVYNSKKDVQKIDLPSRKRTTRKSSSKKSDPSDKEGRLAMLTADLNEQWKLIKAMRKRQEATLRAAEKEREEVGIMLNLRT